MKLVIFDPIEDILILRCDGVSSSVYTNIKNILDGRCCCEGCDAMNAGEFEMMLSILNNERGDYKFTTIPIDGGYYMFATQIGDSFLRCLTNEILFLKGELGGD